MPKKKESKDVCVWEYIETRYYNTSCDREDPFRPRGSFCPYCGKKIQVKE